MYTSARSSALVTSTLCPTLPRPSPQQRRPALQQLLALLTLQALTIREAACTRLASRTGARALQRGA